MIASIPLLAAGYPPISIQVEHRVAYYMALRKVLYSLGTVVTVLLTKTRIRPLLPDSTPH